MKLHSLFYIIVVGVLGLMPFSTLATSLDGSWGNETATLKVTDEADENVIDAAPIGQTIRLTLIPENLNDGGSDHSETVVSSHFWSDTGLDEVVTGSLTTLYTPDVAGTINYGGTIKVQMQKAPPHADQTAQRDTAPAGATADSVKVDSVTCSAGGASQVGSSKNWGVVKATGNVTVEVSTTPNNARDWDKVTWTGGTEVAGDKRHRTVTKASSDHTNVKASAGATNADLDIWVIWATLTLDNDATHSTGPTAPGAPASTYPNAPIFTTTDYTNNNLGLERYVDNGNNLAGIKVCIIAKITPANINTAISTGFSFVQQSWFHNYKDNVADVPNWWNAAWQPDGPDAAFMHNTPDNNDQTYAIDGPNVGQFNSVNKYAKDGNLQIHMTWNSTQASDDLPWKFSGLWTKGANPEVNPISGGPGAINPLP